MSLECHFKKPVSDMRKLIADATFIFSECFHLLRVLCIISLSSDNKESACKAGDPSFDPWVGNIPLEKGMATLSSILAWRVTGAEEPVGLQSVGSQRVRHD